MLFRRLGMLFGVFSIALLPLAVQAAEPADVAAASVPATPGMTGSVIDAQAQAEALKDVSPSSWAYQAIVDLVKDGIIIGYPDGEFKGNRPLTRYEAAVLVERAVQYLTKKLSVPATAAEVSQADIDRLRALLDEFRGDIDSLKLKVADIDSRLRTVEATQARAKLGAVYFIRAGNFSESVNAYSNAYAAFGCPGLTPGFNQCNGALPGNVPLTGGGLTAGSNVAANKYYSGLNTGGYGYQLLRLLLDGSLDSRFSYHLRLENRYYWDTPSAQLSSTATPGGTAASVPNYQTATNNSAAFSVFDYPTNTTVRLNYAYMQYQDPSGAYAFAGRLNETDGTLGMLYADQFNGAKVGFSNNVFKIEGGYAYDFPSYDAGGQTTSYTAATNSTAGTCTFPVNNPNCGYATQTIFGQVSYQPTKNFLIGGSYIDDINARISTWNPTACTFAGPTAGTCYTDATRTRFFPLTGALAGTFGTAVTNLATVGGFGRYTGAVANVPISLEAEGSFRLGNDPYTGTSWTQNTAYWFQGKLGAYNPTPFKAYIEGGFIGAGYNSISAHTSIVNGVSYDGQYQGNPNGYQISYAGLHYWFSRYGRIGVVWNYYDLLSNTTLPVASAAYASTYLTHDIGQGIFLQTYLQF